MNELALFAGAGGGILGGHLLGWNTIGAVEIEEYPRQVLLARQRDSLLPPFPIWDDVCTFDGRPWRGLVDVVSGGFPCQDISSAGRGAGITGERSGLWREMFRIIREIRPRFAFMENSPMLTSRGLGTVLGDLAEAGFDAEWMVLGAHSVGAPHRRDRIWILAEDTKYNMDWHTDRFNVLSQPEVCGGTHTITCGICADVPDPNLPGCEEQRGGKPTKAEYKAAECGGWWCAEPDVGRVADGVASRVDRLKAIGNGQVPLVAATAFLELKRRLEK